MVVPDDEDDEDVNLRNFRCLEGDVDGEQLTSGGGGSGSVMTGLEDADSKLVSNKDEEGV